MADCTMPCVSTTIAQIIKITVKSDFVYTPRNDVKTSDMYFLKEKFNESMDLFYYFPIRLFVRVFHFM